MMNEVHQGDSNFYNSKTKNILICNIELDGQINYRSS
jgi:hypothetical protein